MVNKVSRVKILIEFGQILNSKKEQQLVQNKLNSKIQNFVSIVARKANLLGFFEVLAIFIWKKQYKRKENPEKGQLNF